MADTTDQAKSATSAAVPTPSVDATLVEGDENVSENRNVSADSSETDYLVDNPDGSGVIHVCAASAAAAAEQIKAKEQDNA